MLRRFYALLLVAAALLVGATVWFRPIPSPNILLVTLDTTRADRLGCYGYAVADTPTLDALAEHGLRFERAYVPAPMTAPSHTSLFTGLWPPEHGVYTNGRIALEHGIPTLAEHLRQSGYDTAAFVAAFVLTRKFGLDRGFAVYDDDLSQAESGGDVLHKYRDGKFVIDSAIAWLTKRAAANSRAPFFAWVHLYDPHDPYLDHAEDFGDTFRDRPYDAEIAYVDRQIGRLIQTLDKLGQRENTVLVVVGDHGESLGEHGEETHGYTLHDATLRVPLIIADPRSKSAGRVVAAPVSLVNLFPTLLDLAGLSQPKLPSLASLEPALRGESIPSQTCYSQTEEPYLQAFWSPLQSWTTDRWRYVRTTKPELYDLGADPEELANLAADHPDLLSELDGELTAFENTLQRRAGARINLSAREQRALESLGYTGGGTAAEASASGGNNPLPDIKDMLPYLSQLQAATHLLDEEQYDAAAEILTPLAQVPNLLRARLNLGQCRLQQENYAEAAKLFEAALEIDPNSDRALDMLGFAYLKLQRLDDAERQFRKLLGVRPDSETGHLFLGEIYQRREKYPEALRHYEETLRINPQNAPARQAWQALVQALRSSR